MLVTATAGQFAAGNMTVDTGGFGPFCKKQHMQWSKEGVHLLLQSRVRTLNGALADIFTRWYQDLDMKAKEIPIATA